MPAADANEAKERLLSLLLKKKGITTAAAHRLVRRADSGPVPLSYAQRRLWILDRLGGGTPEYNMPQAQRLRGVLDRAALERAVNAIVERHESLRTHFTEKDGEPVQIIAPTITIRVPLDDFSVLDDAARREAVAAAQSREVQEPFDLERGPLLRVRLLRIAEQEHVLLTTLHHIASDIWSMGVFGHEFSLLYAAFREGRDSPLGPLPVQYADFTVWQRKRLEGGGMREGLAYWRRQLSGAPDRLDLPTDRPRPKTQTFAARDYSLTIPSDRVKALKELGRRSEATLYMTLFAAFAALLQRHTGQDDIVVGSPIANRQDTQLEQLIGFFVNALVMRVRINARASFRDLLADVRDLARDAYLYQDIPFERLVEELSPERSLSTTPLFQVTFALQNAPSGAQNLPGLDVEPVDGGELRVRFDIEVYAFEHSAGLEILWIYNRDLFDRWHVEQMARDYVALLESALADPDTPIYRLRAGTVPAAEQGAYRRSDAVVPRIFAEMEARNPEAIALVYGDVCLSYRSLNARANRLAHHLIAQGVGPETLVGVALDRSIELIVAALAVLKAGGAYVPIASTLPEQRREDLVAHVGHVVTPETFGQLADQSEENPPVALLPEHPAYINFTSGSTGEPKGVLVPHAAIVRLVQEPNYVQLDAASRILQFAPLSFDAATFEIWGALLNGGTLVVPPADIVSTDEIADAIVKQRVNTLWLTSGLFSQMVDQALTAFAGVRQLLAGGDVLSPEHVHQVLRAHPHCRFINGYGPTENTTFSCCFTVPADADLRGGVPIGAPINGTQAYVLDAALETVPLGACGELYVSGIGLARGYLRQPALTAERFVANPFVPGARMYRTGDLVRRLPDGKLVFLGRTDDQLKLRGYRIEPGEIEAALRRHERVQDALVTVREQAGHKELLAYVIGCAPGLPAQAHRDHSRDSALPRNGAEGADLGQTLKAFLQRLLPDYMVPAAVVVLQSWPLTSSGKVDRAALPIPRREQRAGSSYRAPRSAEERVLCGLFAEVLGLECVGIDDGFFALGGDSIMSIKLVSRARREGLDLTPRDVFQHQTVEALAVIVRRSDTVARPQRDETAGAGEVPMTPIVHWFIERCAAVRRFQQSMLLAVPAELTDARLVQALQALVDHHDVLRLRLEQGRLYIAPRGAVPARECVSTVKELNEASLRTAEDRLDPEDGRVLQCVRCGSRLMVMIHHLAVDGVSWRILIPDLMTALSAAASGATPVLDPVGTPFRLWAEYLAKRARSPGIIGELPVWEAILDGAGPLVPGAALDASRDTVANAGQLVVSVRPELTSALLTNVPAAFHARINDVLLSALAVAVDQRRTGPVLIDLEGHGREESDPDINLSRTVGWFTSMFPVALDAGGIDGGRALKRVKEQLRAVPGQGLGFGLLRYMNPDTAPRLAARAQPQIGFNYFGRFSAGDSGAAGVGGGADASMPLAHVLDINAQTIDGPDGPSLSATWTWAAAHLCADDVRAMADAWLHALEMLAREVEAGAGGHTPSDFPLLTLSQSEIERVEAAYPGLDDILPLSPLQEGLVFHALYDETAPDVYTVQICVELHGPLDTRRLHAAARGLLRRHANLRAAIHHESLDRPVQVIAREAELPWRVVDISTNRDEVLAAEYAKRFVLAKGPLLRLAVLSLAPERHLLALTYHHLLMDGWSMPIFFGELLELYRSGGDDSVLPRVRPYKDYLRWLARQNDDAATAAWRAYLADLDGPTSLVPSHAPEAPAGLPENCRRALSQELSLRLQALARARGLTLNTIVQGIWAVLLARLTGRDDVVFGVTMSGRPAELVGIEQMVGLFINALPLRVRLDPNEPMHALLTRIQQSQSLMMSHQHVGLGRIQRAVEAANLFDTLLVYENYPMDHAAFAATNHDLRMTAADGRDAVHFPLSLLVVPGEQLSLRIRYDPLSISNGRAQAMIDQVESLAQQIVEHPDWAFRDYSLVAGDAGALLPDPQAELPEPEFEPVTATIARVAARGPGREAVHQAGRSWTYAELIHRAEAIAQRLLGADVKRGEVVAIVGRRSFETVAAMLGVMMSAAVALALDPNLPQKRRDLMLGMCRVRVILGDDLDGTIGERRGLPRLSPADPAYVFFTSGSTGAPKGVLGCHKGLAHFIQWEGDEFDVGPEDRVAQLTHLSFDPMLRDIFLPLTRGGTLCLPEQQDETGGEQVLAWMQRARITILHAVPSLAQWWLTTVPKGQPVPTLRWTLFAGEPLMGELVRRWRAAFSPSGGVANFYGPTETTLAKCMYRVPLNPEPGLQPVGWTLPQTQALVVSPLGKLCGIGEPGEVVIRTPFRSLGYIGPDGEVQWPWKPNPLRADDGVYFSGDAGRYLPCGALEIVGRLDDQVKIRGVRMDPNEVAAVLLGHPHVAECVVMARGPESEKRLVAYVVGTEPARALIAYASERLPESMVPSRVVVLPSMPLTRNGKVDRRALRDPAVEPQNASGSIAPRDCLELRVARLWEDVLGVAQVGVRDDFFDLGGHSLRALRLVTRIAAEIGVRLPAAVVFRHRTVEELVAAIRTSVPWSPIVPIQARGSQPPLFCVHPQGGLAIGYVALARSLGADQPFYGLQAIGMEEGQEPLDSVQAMAAMYVEAIRQMLPNGPYLLSGYSYGGRVAYEMAQLLRRTGKEVSLLALLDSASPALDDAATTDVDDATLLCNLVPDDIGMTVEELRRLDADERLSRVIAKAHERGLVPTDLDAEGLRRWLRVYKSNIVAGRRHRLEPYPGRITLLQTEERAAIAEQNSGEGWCRLALGGCDVRIVPGTHMTLMQPPAVATLAERLRECLLTIGA